jgi:spore germination protein GerM
MLLTLYFLGPNGAYHVPVNRQTPFTVAVAGRAFELMREGPRAGSNLLRSVPQGMQLNGLRVEGGTLYADLVQSFEELGAGAAEAMAFVWAMTEFTTVFRVQFLVNGTPVGLPGSADTGPVARPAYVNYENPHNLAPADSVALKLFLATPDLQHLFPVVRRVPSTSETARATLEEMIAGPSAAFAGLAVSPLAPGTQIRSISRDGNTIVVDFSAAFSDSPSVDLAAQSVLFAAAGLTPDSYQGIDSVRIYVEGAEFGFYSVYDYVLNPEW